MKHPFPTTSANGRYHIEIHSSEMRMSHWVNSPKIIDQQQDITLLDLHDSLWSVLHIEWKSNHIVLMNMMKYPNGMKSYQLELNLEHKKMLSPQKISLDYLVDWLAQI